MKKTLLAIAFASSALLSQAQNVDNGQWLIEESRRLYNNSEYTSLLTLLSRIDRDKLDGYAAQEYEQMYAIAFFETDPIEGRAILLDYLNRYPETTKRELMNALIAESYYYNHKYAEAVEWFGKSDLDALSPREKERAELFLALSSHECGNKEAARQRLTVLSHSGEYYKDDAAFHLSVINYDENRLDEAYNGFKAVEGTEKYYLEVPYYLAAIYLKNGENSRAEKVAEAFINDHKEKPQGIEMLHILGAARFAQGRFDEASQPLKEYIKKSESPQRIAIYQLAQCHFEEGSYDEAKALFEYCATSGDELSQSALFHLGVIGLKEENSNQARFCFERAVEIGANSDITEEALYNYALCVHESNYSPFAESVKAFERFLNEYPDSKYIPNVDKYLVEVYMNTRSYDVALQSINKINNPSPALLEAKQKVLYRLGVQALIDEDNDSALSYMNASLELANYNKDTHSDAQFWKSEILYRNRQYDDAIQGYSKVIAIGERNNSNALYGLGYSHFQKGDYKNALKEFNRYIQMAKNEDSKTTADVYNRIGDCYFYNRNYSTANKYYNEAVKADASSGDYALIRAATTQGLARNYPAKIKALNSLVSNYPSSVYIDEAYYELGRTYSAQGNFGKAVQAYNILIQSYPHSSFARRAEAEMASTYYQDGRYDKAIAAYKNIIAKYPKSEEAQLAAGDLKNIYVELGRVDEYATYAANTPGMTPVGNEEHDNLSYSAAERIYSKGDVEGAKREFEKYLSKFPDGANSLNAHYYLGAIYYSQDRKDEAIHHFSKVTEYPDNRFGEDAMAAMADIYYSKKEYKEAIELYGQVAEQSNNEVRRTNSRLNLLRSAYSLGEDELTISTANDLIAGNISPDNEPEVRYYRVKTNLKNNVEGVESDLEHLAKDTRSKYGAEAKYLLAQYYFDHNREQECEEVIMDYIKCSTPHSYWLARSFVLLADLYTKQGKEGDAKMYLQSLKSNYDANDDIASMIEERLENLSQSN